MPREKRHSDGGVGTGRRAREGGEFARGLCVPPTVVMKYFMKHNSVSMEAKTNEDSAKGEEIFSWSFVKKKT